MIKERVAKLIDVKSIVTFALTAGFLVLSLKGEIKADQFQSIFLMVVSFYFGTQVQKKAGT